jgi:hypothetical protein
MDAPRVDDENGGSELPGYVAVQTELRLSLPEPLSGPAP